MVSSRHRSSTAAATTTATETTVTRVPKPPLEEWTIREKLCLASLAIKHNNSWNSVARNMQAFVGEKERSDGRYNQKTCAAQFDKLMNELGVDKRPKRNEQSDASGSVIYKKMAEKRIKELEENTVELRKTWLNVCNELKVLDNNGSSHSDKSDSLKPKTKPTTAGPKAAAKAITGTGTSSDSVDKPPTRALTRRESSRQNLEKTLAVLYKEASEIKPINQLCRPTPDVERTLGSYDKLILRHVDMSTLKKRLGGEVDDPYAVMNDLLLMFQNATMYYPADHPTYKIAVELRDKLVPQWERSFLDRFKSRH